MDMEECPGLKHCAGERWWGEDTQGCRDNAKGTEQRVSFSTVQDRGREVAWKKGEEKPHFTYTVVELTGT